VALHPEHTQSVLSLKGGRLYKADFQVCGFRAIHIVFNELGGRDGWFFGKRPEFYFPRLPLCYATIGVILFLPPLALALAILLQKMIFEAFSK
jgi:Gpi18-like mannosyltransferase